MILDPVLDFFRGKAVTIPPLDGAFRPNTGLEELAGTAIPCPDDLALWRGQVVVSSGSRLLTLTGEVLATYPTVITALAVSPAGSLAVGLGDGLIIDGAPVALPPGIGCITALAYAGGRLWLANGSDTLRASEWATDLMMKNASGSVWVLDETWRRVAHGLAWPNGLLPEGKTVVVSEAWRHRLIRLDGRPVLDGLPGYPARLSPAPGGAWLALFAPRNRLVEFVLQETHYRLAMMAEVPPAFWIAPALRSGDSFLEPLQCGGIRMLGVHKPWSPARSYGLVVRLGPDLKPTHSLHSRANGARHGVTSVLQVGDTVHIASKGGDLVLRGAA